MATRNKVSASSSRQFGLFARLPYELREMIWLHLMPWNTERKKPEQYGRSNYFRFTGIMCASWALEKELASVLYPNTIINFILTRVPISRMNGGYCIWTTLWKWVGGAATGTPVVLTLQDVVNQNGESATCYRNLTHRRKLRISIRLTPPHEASLESLLHLYDAVVKVVKILRRAKPTYRKSPLRDIVLDDFRFRQLPTPSSTLRWYQNDSWYMDVAQYSLIKNSEHCYCGGLSDLFIMLGPFGMLQESIDIKMPENSVSLHFPELWKIHDKARRRGKLNNRVWNDSRHPILSSPVAFSTSTELIHMTLAWDAVQGKPETDVYYLKLLGSTQQYRRVKLLLEHKWYRSYRLRGDLSGYSKPRPFENWPMSNHRARQMIRTVSSWKSDMVRKAFFQILIRRRWEDDFEYLKNAPEQYALVTTERVVVATTSNGPLPERQDVESDEFADETSSECSYAASCDGKPEEDDERREAETILFAAPKPCTCNVWRYWNLKSDCVTLK